MLIKVVHILTTKFEKAGDGFFIAERDYVIWLHAELLILKNYYWHDSLKGIVRTMNQMSHLPPSHFSSNNINQWMDEEVELVDKKGKTEVGKFFF